MHGRQYMFKLLRLPDRGAGEFRLARMPNAKEVKKYGLYWDDRDTQERIWRTLKGVPLRLCTGMRQSDDVYEVECMADFNGSPRYYTVPVFCLKPWSNKEPHD